MNKALAKPCASDSDYARFARFYLRRSKEFRSQYTIYEAAAHILTTMQGTRILLFENESGELIGFIQYQYVESEATAFIESVILSEEYRSSRVFFEGFRDLARQVCREYAGVKQFRFHALSDNRYLNRLYGKFAAKSGERNGADGTENVYIAELDGLLTYLGIVDR